MVKKEGSCNIIHNKNLSGISILFPNKRHGLSKATNWVAIHYLLSKKKSELFGQPKSNIASGQINCIISYDQYISQNRYAGEGKIIERNCKMSTNVDKLKKTTTSFS